MDLFSLLCETNLVPEVFLIESYTFNTDKKDYEKSLFFLVCRTKHGSRARTLPSLIWKKKRNCSQSTDKRNATPCATDFCVLILQLSQFTSGTVNASFFCR